MAESAPTTTAPRLLGPTAVGQTNRRRVLELLHQNGPSSRAQLARALSVSRATIATIVQPFIDDRTLVEGDPVAASPAGGKPARPLWFNSDGVELGAMRISATAVTVARMGMDGTIHQQGHGDLDPGAPIDEVRTSLLELASSCFEDRPLLGIGVAASGMVDTTEGVIISLHLAPVLNGFPLAAVLRRRFATPVSVDHHPRVQALGDRWFGHGRHQPSFASVYTGEALGFGIVYDGEIVRGVDGAGGEYGHTVVDMNGDECMCGRRGCWETVATSGWLRREALRLGLPGAAGIDCATLTAMAGQRVPAAAELLDRYARNLAIGMANNEHMLGSGVYIMHGDVCAGGEAMRERLQRWMVEYSPRRGVAPQVILGDFGDEITLLGGGGLVLSSVLATAV
ncbi:MAG TPA: ROK family protein [Actinopolymorphaceae bacterium]|jgi:predicted NBD/HSP70 family sugar kinase